MGATETVIDRLRRVGREAPGEVLYTFVDDAGADAARMTWGDTLADASAVAGRLARAGLEPGDRAVLVYAPSLDFVRAFIGCLLARVVPVPVAPPNPYNLEQDLPPVATIARTARAKAILTDGVFAGLREYAADHPDLSLPDLPWIDTTAPSEPAADPMRPSPSPDDVAFVQYTSGSTSAPRGVLITFGNLAHQLAVNAQDLGLGPDARGLMWVPHYHDFGLVSGILTALHGNGALWMMSPLSFVQRPHLWMEVASRVRATHTAAPNFAYDLAVRKSTAEQRRALDLSSMRVAMSAAEPVRPETVRAFLDAFAPSGFDPKAFCPAYGLAEHTVGVSVRGRASVRVDRSALERDRRVEPAGPDAPATDCVGCGRPSEGVTVRVVDRDSGEALGPGRVGELWVDSPSKAAGYDGLPDETRETFEARLPGDDRSYLRTGDLGFLHEGEVFVVGRIKDTVIVRGRNLHPQDVEDSVRSCHDLVRPGGVAAFGLRGPAASGDELAVIVELRFHEVDAAQAAAVAAAVRERVVRDHRQSCQVVVLARPGSVLKTSSGKLRRRASREAFERGEFPALYVDRAGSGATLADVVEGMDADLRKIAGDVGRWFARASRARGGRMFHKEATTLAGHAEAAPDPALPPLGLLAGGNRYPVLVRHANGVQDDDAAWDNRGATVRLLRPDAGGALDAPLLDLLLTTGRCFLAPTAKAFLRWMSGSPAERDAVARADSQVATAAWEMFRAPESYAGVHYHSKTASLLLARDGTRHYARFRLRRPDLDADGGFVHGESLLPPDSIPRREGDTRPATFLHDELKQRVAAGGVDYVLEVQLHPVEESALDCTRPWHEPEHPWRVAMRLHLDRVADAAAVEALHFNSLHAPAELAPPVARSAAEPASLETLREVVYEVAACARLGEPLPPPLAALMTDAPSATSEAPAKKGRPLRVCVIGAGASGLTAAWNLHQQGHQVTVLEAAPEVAGKCASVRIDDRAYDLGGHLCTPQYKAVARLVAQMGLAMEPATPTFNYDVEGRRVIPWDEGPALREAFLKYRALRETDLAALDRPGLGDVAAEAAAPALEWLEARGLSALGEAVGASFTSTGYGYLRGGEIPAIYFLKAAETAGLLAKDGHPDLPRYWTVRGGMQALWDRVASRLPDVRRGVKVRAVERRDGRVRVSVGRERLEFDRLVVAIPVDDALRFLDATLEERELFGEVRHLDYYTTVARAQGVPEGGFYILRQNTDDPSRVGHCVALHHRHPGSDVVLFYSYGDDQTDGRDVEARLREDVAAMGGTVGEVLLQKRWKYFPHFDPEAVAGGAHARLEALQGQNATWYCGSLFNFELIECNVAYSEALVARHFGDEAPAPSAAAAVTRAARSVDEVRAWLGAAVAKVAKASAQGVDLEAPIERLGLDSLAVTTLVTQLSDWLGWSVSTSLLYEQRTLARVAQALARVDVERTAPRPAQATATAAVAPAAVEPAAVHRRAGGDMDDVRAYWRHHFGVSRWPFEDLIFAFIERFVDHVAFEDRAAFDRVRDRGCLYLANHQVSSEPAMLSTIMAGLSGKHLVGLAKIEGLAGDMGWFMEHMFAYPGVVHPKTYVFIDRSKPEELGDRIAELAAGLSSNSRNVLVHVQGTRSTNCREPVRGLNPMFVEMALATGAPIVPVRFTGGLPAEPLAEKIDFPIGHTKQVYWIGRPILPEELADLGFVERTERVLAGMNDLGMSNAVEEPGPPDPAFSARVDAWHARTGAASLWNTLCAVMESLPDPSPDTGRLLDGARDGRLVLGDSPVDRWLAALARKLYGPRGPEVVSG